MFGGTGTGKACSSFFVKISKKNIKKVLTGILFGGIISMKLKDQRNEERQVLNHENRNCKMEQNSLEMALVPRHEQRSLYFL